MIVFTLWLGMIAELSFISQFSQFLAFKLKVLRTDNGGMNTQSSDFQLSVGESNLSLRLLCFPLWLLDNTPLSRPITSKTKTNRNLLARIFLRLASATWNCFVFWLVHYVVCVSCDWSDWFLWFSFYGNKLNTALESSKGEFDLISNREE